MSITKTQAQTNALTNEASIHAAANALFYVEVDAQIQQAVAQGIFFVYSTTSENINPSDVFTHYTQLGYQVTFPGFSSHSTPAAPPDSDNGFWVSSWLNSGLNKQRLEKPYKFLISWK